MIDIKTVQTKRETELFAGFPNVLYKGDSNYVPALYKFEKELFDRNKNSFFRHAEAEFFLAFNGDEITGRIVAIKNHDHITHSGRQEGFFGFFESYNDPETAGRLLDAACEWLRKRGLKKMTGPENFSTNEVCGILTEGFYDPPVFMMPYNKNYYRSLFEHYGLTCVMGLSSFKVVPTDASRQMEILAARIESKLSSAGVLFRSISFENFDQDINMMHDAYNLAFSNNWGFVPLTAEDFMQSAIQLKKICDRSTIILAVKEDKCIGFIVNVPDINQVLIHVKNGKLFPFGFISLLRSKNKIDRYRILIIGTVPEHRHKGIDICLITKTIQNLDKLGIRQGEAAYVMDDNKPMKDILDRLGAIPVKKYALYQCQL